jgi:5-methylcytosine-specific restriction endonuclease McrA
MLNQGVLVLNKHWTAIHVCSVRRALGLVVEDLARVVNAEYQTFDFNSWAALSAHIEEHGNEFIHTPRLQVLVPEVILLVGYHRMPPRTVKFNRKNIYIRDGYTCQYCGATPPREELTIDHVIPRSRGGRSTWENVALACQRCNAKKGNRLLTELTMKLTRPPKRPHWFSTLRTSLRNTERPVWQKFVDVAYWNVPLEEE